MQLPCHTPVICKPHTPMQNEAGGSLPGAQGSCARLELVSWAVQSIQGPGGEGGGGTTSYSSRRVFTLLNPQASRD